MIIVVLILANAVRYIDAYENLEKFYGDLVERMRRGGSLNKTEEQLLGYYQSIYTVYPFIKRQNSEVRTLSADQFKWPADFFDKTFQICYEATLWYGPHDVTMYVHFFDLTNTDHFAANCLTNSQMAYYIYIF